MLSRRYLAAALALLVALSAIPAYAVPVSVGDKREQAQRIKSQVDALDDKVEVAAEDYNEAYEQHAAIAAKIKSTQAELDKTNARIGTLQTHLAVRASSMYRSGPAGFVEVLLGAKDFDELATTWDLLTDMNEREARDVSDLKEARATAERYQKDLATQEAAAAEKVAEMKAKKSAIEAQLSERKSMLTGLENEIAAIEAAEEARAAAAARASSSFWAA
jgi:peptidoglycan hydrolase CwlO-like protein